MSINWAWGDSTETIGIQAYVIDVSSASDQDNYSNIFGVEAHLSSSTLAVDDYRCNIGGTLTFSGYWYYDGTSVAPPNGDYQVKIKLGAVQKGSTDTTLVSGAFSVNDVSASTTVGQYNYTVEATYMTGAGSFSPVIADATMLFLSIEDNRLNIGDNVYANLNATYAYDGSDITDGTITLNGTNMAYQGGNWWRLNMTQATVGQWTYCVDSVSGNTYGITQFGIISLDGASDRFTIPDSPDFAFSSGFTLAVWCKPSATNVLGILIYQYDAVTGDGFQLYQSDTSKWMLRVDVGGVSQIISSDSAPTTNWQHIVGMREADGTLKMYVDGVLQTDTDTNAGVIDSTSSVYVGTLGTAPLFDYAGLLCEHRFYNRSLQEPEIYQLYQGRQTNNTGLVALYSRPSYDMQDALWRDLSGNGHDGVIGGVTVAAGLSTDETVRPIWDALDVSNIQAPQYLGSGVYQYDVEIRYAFDNVSVSGGSVNVTSMGGAVGNSSGWASIVVSQGNLSVSGTYTVFGVDDNSYWGITVPNANQTFSISKWILSTSDIEGNVLSNATINVNSGTTSVWSGQYAIIDLYVPAASYSVNVTWLQNLSLNTTGSISVLSDTSTVLNCTAYPYNFGGSTYDIASNATVSSKTFSSNILTLTFSSPTNTYLLVSNCPSPFNYITNTTYDLATDFSLSYLVLTHYSNATLSFGCESWSNLYVYFTDKLIKTVTLVSQRFTVTTTGLTGEIGTLKIYCGSRGNPPDLGGFTTSSYASSILTGTYSFSSDASLWLDWTSSSGPTSPGGPGDTSSYSPSVLLATVFLSFPDSALKNTVLDGWLNVSWTGMPKIYVWSVTCDSPFEGWRVQVVSGLPFELKMNFTSGYESIPVQLEIPVDAEGGALSVPCSITLATPQGTTKTIRAIVYLSVVSTAQTVPDLLTYSFLGIFAVMIGLTVFRRRRKAQTG